MGKCSKCEHLFTIDISDTYSNHNNERVTIEEYVYHCFYPKKTKEHMSANDKELKRIGKTTNKPTWCPLSVGKENI